jgi:iron(III)-enterobactin esterase
VLLAPGPAGQRTIEYDTVSDRYTNFVETEVLPRITRDYQVAFTTDPEGRATMGESSGSAAALTMAWLQPNLYRRVISYSGTFVALQRNATAPNGAWDFHQTFIPNSERKPLRIWLHVSENDLGADTPADQMRNWVIANNRMVEVLKAKGYPYQFVFSDGVGHVDRRVQLQTMPEAFEWLWKGYKPSGR